MVDTIAKCLKVQLVAPKDMEGKESYLGIKISVPGVTNWLQKASLVMPNTDQRNKWFYSYPTDSSKVLIICFSEAPRK